MSVTSFFGTDGIRGKTSLHEVDEDEAITLLEHDRTLTPAFMRLVGEALSYAQPELREKHRRHRLGCTTR